MTPHEVRMLRSELRLSRAELARFLGVSDVTVFRWETVDPKQSKSRPHGLVLTVLRAIRDATDKQGPGVVSRLVREGVLEQRAALIRLFGVANPKPCLAPPTLEKSSIVLRRRWSIWVARLDYESAFRLRTFVSIGNDSTDALRPALHHVARRIRKPIEMRVDDGSYSYHAFVEPHAGYIQNALDGKKGK